MSHSLIVDLPAVDPSRDMTYAMQLRDLTEKLVRARQMGFSRVYLSRVRDSGVLPDGLLTRDNRAHPAFYAFRTLNAVLSGKEVTPLQLDLASGARHTFFRDTKTGELTFFIFPGDKSVTEDLPFGHNVSRIDLMGNPVPLPSGTGKGDLGTVRVVLEPNGLPVILTGIDTQLMDAMQAVKLDDATIQGYEGDQRKKLSVTNTFSTAITLTVRIPLAAAENDLDNIARDARFKTSQGNEVAESMSEYRFESVELAPGATRDFEFMLRPRQSMKTGSRVLPITLQIRGQREYAVTRRLPVTVNPLVSVAKIDLVDLGDGRGYDVVMRVADTSGRNGAYVATVSLPGMEGTRPLTRDFSIAGNGFADVTRRIQAATAAQLEGQVLRLSLRQNPGAMFFNEDYVVRKNYSTGGLMLVRERDERSAVK